MQRCSLIIPSFNNAAVLPQSLQALAAQYIPDGWSVQLIICDDESSDATPEIAATYPLPDAWARQVVTGSHAGAATARNRGIAAATGDIVFFLQADILLRPSALSAHLYFHEQHPAEHHAALGFVSWDPDIRPSPIMEWMIHGGSQNAYDELLGTHEARPTHDLYGAHLSIKRRFLGPSPFNTALAQYGWEDIELGRRLAAQGLRLHVLHHAQALHHHYYDVHAICRRQYAVGQSLVQYQALHPQADLTPPSGKFGYLKYVLAWYSGGAFFLRYFLASTGEKFSTPRLFGWLTGTFYWRGVYK